MRSKQLLFVATVILSFITFALIARQAQVRNGFEGAGLGIFNQFRGARLAFESQDSSIVIEHTPGSDKVVPHRIGMVTMVIGEAKPTYERALRTHLRHGEIQGYETFVMRSSVLDMMFNKPMFILNILMEEMMKPFHERLEWLFWFDGDSVLLNPKLGLSHFLPPAEFSDSNLLVTNDHNGLNNGVFFIRVCSWSIEIMAATVAYRTFNPDDKLDFRDQSALEILIHKPQFRDQVDFCPQRWFNAYQSGLLSETIQPNQVRRGDLMVHFAGIGNRDERMNYWCDIAEKHLPDWEMDFGHTSYLEEIEDFWKEKRERDTAEKEEVRSVSNEATSLIKDVEKSMTMYRQNLTDSELSKIDEAKKKTQERIGKTTTDLVRQAVQQLKEASVRLDELGKEGRKQAVKDAHTTMVTAEKLGLNADHLREVLVDVNDWQGIQDAMAELKARIERKANETR